MGFDSDLIIHRRSDPLGSNQRIRFAVNDRIGIEPKTLDSTAFS